MTLSQIIALILRFGQSHGMINTVARRSVADWLDKENVYAALFFDFVSARKVPKAIAYTLRFYAVDRITLESHNEEQVWSDAVMIAHDLLSALNCEDLVVDSVTDFTPVSEQSGDLLSGIYFDITLRTIAPLKRSEVPTKSDSIHTDEHTGVFG